MSGIRTYRPQGIFDVRDHVRERQRGDGLAATVSGRVRFAVTAVRTPDGPHRPAGWYLHTRPTASGLAVFLDRIVEDRRPPVLRRLPAAVTGVELRVTSPGFQSRDVAFRPGTGRRIRIDLEPAVDYPFASLPPPAGGAGPALLRGSVRDDDGGRPVAGAVVEAADAWYPYRTGRDGAFVLVLPDDLPWSDAGEHPVTVRVAQTVLRETVTAVRGTTVSVPELRLRQP